MVKDVDCRRWQDHILRITLFLLFFIPPLVVVPGSFGGKWVFTSYREPKLAAIQILSWLFLTIFWWVVWGDEARRERLRVVLLDRWTWLLGFFFLYLCLTVKDALVIEAAWYELAQYWTLINLYIALVVLWQEPVYLRTAMTALGASFAVVTALGLYQLWQPISFLIPIKGPVNPSTMGYKNPAALAVLGQVFIAMALVTLWARDRRFTLAGIGIIVVLAEVVYISTLQSRTSYFAFSVSIVFFLSLLLMSHRKREGTGILKVTVLGIVAAVMVFGAILATYPPAQKRVQNIVIYFKEPAKFLTSDRGTYLRNSIYMANQNLFGVGIGNWGFAYPVYRHFQPKKLFNKQIQVRRAHGDYAQMLGEIGWPGFMLWVSLLGWVLCRGLRTVRHSAEMSYVLIVVQLLAFLLVMLFDYCI
jgi:O-antigen ligase